MSGASMDRHSSLKCQYEHLINAVTDQRFLTVLTVLELWLCVHFLRLAWLVSHLWLNFVLVSALFVMIIY